MSPTHPVDLSPTPTLTRHDSLHYIEAAHHEHDRVVAELGLAALRGLAYLPARIGHLLAHALHPHQATGATR